MNASTAYYDAESEETVLAAFFVLGDTKVFEARECLSPLDFLGDHRIIYETVIHLAETEEPILEASVRDTLDRKNVRLNNPDLVHHLAAAEWVDPVAWDYALKNLIRCREVRKTLMQSERLATGAIRSNGNLPYLKLQMASELAETATAPDDAYLFTQSADDEGNAQCVAKLYTDTFLFCEALGWLYYNGRYWQREDAESILDRAIVETLKQRRVIGVKADAEKLVKAAKPSAANVRNCKFLFKSLVPVSVSSFDSDPDILNCKNGVVDLRTGDLTPHGPGQRFTYCLPVAYNPLADDSAWADWLYGAIRPETIGNADEKPYTDLLEWIQMAVGYSLSGRTNEQCLFYLQGPTRGGKGLFSQTLAAVLGKPLAYGVDFDTFTAKRGGDSQNFDLAPLKAARFVIASESNRANMLNSKVIKAITGNDAVYCAFKHRDHFEYTPQFKIWLSSNFHVMGDANDDALWGRLRVITFPNSYLNREDFTLAAKLQAEAEGVLKWAVDGAKQWYAQLDAGKGLGRPDLISQTTQAHRDENDNVKQFIDECCVVKVGARVVGKTFTIEYSNWCKENGLAPLGGRRLGAAMRSKGFELKNTKITSEYQAKCWRGIGLLTTQPGLEDSD